MAASSYDLQPVGLIGLGPMGRGIASCLLSQGLEVVAYNRTASRTQESIPRIDHAFRELARRQIVPRARIRDWRKRFRLVDSLAGLASCSNTSSLPISILQEGRKRPERFIGMHWGEPAQIMRYLEIIPGRRTSKQTLRLTGHLGEFRGKEPTVLRQDIHADEATVDRSFRNDMGWWALLAWPFRWMDLTGIPAYALVMDGLKTSARRWEQAWVDFTYDLRKLAEKYAEKKI